MIKQRDDDIVLKSMALDTGRSGSGVGVIDPMSDSLDVEEENPGADCACA